MALLHQRLIHQLQYKAAEVGITVVLQDESYSSKCSFLDREAVGPHDHYIGRRVFRGLFRSGRGVLINAAVNGAYNILRQALLNAFGADRIEAVGLPPLRWRLATATC